MEGWICYITNLIVIFPSVFVYQVITLYTLNLDTVIGQLHLNNAGRNRTAAAIRVTMVICKVTCGLTLSQSLDLSA